LKLDRHRVVDAGNFGANQRSDGRRIVWSAQNEGRHDSHTGKTPIPIVGPIAPQAVVLWPALHGESLILRVRRDSEYGVPNLAAVRIHAFADRVFSRKQSRGQGFA